jgi:hypothetical protein
VSDTSNCYKGERKYIVPFPLSSLDELLINRVEHFCFALVVLIIVPDRVFQRRKKKKKRKKKGEKWTCQPLQEYQRNRQHARGHLGNMGDPIDEKQFRSCGAACGVLCCLMHE